jgi:hypothetical protein
MLYYLIHQSPIWRGLPDGKRNVRILFVALTLYVFLHALSYEYRTQNTFWKIINGYFIWFMASDLFACACLYKLYYGRTILKELNTRETDYYDEKTHRYNAPNNDCNKTFETDKISEISKNIPVYNSTKDHTLNIRQEDHKFNNEIYDEPKKRLYHKC